MFGCSDFRSLGLQDWLAKVLVTAQRKHIFPQADWSATTFQAMSCLVFASWDTLFVVALYRAELCPAELCPAAGPNNSGTRQFPDDFAGRVREWFVSRRLERLSLVAVALPRIRKAADCPAAVADSSHKPVAAALKHRDIGRDNNPVVRQGSSYRYLRHNRDRNFAAADTEDDWSIEYSVSSPVVVAERIEPVVERHIDTDAGVDTVVRASVAV